MSYGPRSFMDTLIQLGRSGAGYDPRNPQEYAALQVDCMPDHAELVAQAKVLSQEDFGNLVKGIVLVEESGRWGRRGSTTLVPNLIHPYAEKFGLDSADDLVAWCLRHSSNSYVPFGSLRHREPSYRHHLIAVENCTVADAERAVGRVLEKRRRRLRKSHLAAARRERCDERKGKRQAVISELRRLNPIEQFSMIANSDFPLEAVPQEFVDGWRGTVAAATDAAKRAMVKKIDRRTKAPWRQLRHLIEGTL
jgi:hypothetical protein